MDWQVAQKAKHFIKAASSSMIHEAFKRNFSFSTMSLYFTLFQFFPGVFSQKEIPSKNRSTFTFYLLKKVWTFSYRFSFQVWSLFWSKSYKRALNSIQISMLRNKRVIDPAVNEKWHNAYRIPIILYVKFILKEFL